MKRKVNRPTISLDPPPQPPSSSLSTYLQTMSLRKFSSIPSSFASVCWFGSLFALCFFSLVYLHPPDKNVINIFKLNTPTNTTTVATSEHISNEKAIDTLSNKQYAMKDRPNFDTPTNSTSVDELVENSEAPAENNSRATAIKLPESNEFVANSTTAAEFDSNATDSDLPENDELVTNSAAPAEISYNATANDLPKSDEFVQNSAPDSTEQASNTTVIEEVTSPSAAQTTTNNLEEETEEDYNTIPSVDFLSNPPWNISREERIEWLKQKLPLSKILKSTTRTIKFDEKIQEFLRGQDSHSTCKVNIFMIWISPTRLFGKRELLALETVLKAHPQGCVILLSKSMASKPGQELLQPLIDRGHRLLTVVPDFRLLFSNTPAQGWLERLESGDIDPGTIPITQNLSNLLRLVVLYKYGGVYLDTDVIILKDVSAFKNAVGIQSFNEETRIWKTLNNAVLLFDREHPVLLKFMEEFISNFNGFKWGYNGPYLVTRVVQRLVEDSNYDFNLLSPMAFYAVDFTRIGRLFRNPKGNESNWIEDRYKEINAEAYGIHLWNRFSRGLKIEKKSVIGRLINKHCIICQNVYDS